MFGYLWTNISSNQQCIFENALNAKSGSNPMINSVKIMTTVESIVFFKFLPDSDISLKYLKNISFAIILCTLLKRNIFVAILPSTPASSLSCVCRVENETKTIFYRASKIWLRIRTKTQRKHFLSPSAMCVGYFMQITQFNVLPEIIFSSWTNSWFVCLSEVPLGSCLRRDTHSCDSHNIPWQSDFDGYTFGMLNHWNSYWLRGRVV